VSEYLQENRRAVIMLVVAVAVALLGGLYLLLSGGSESTDLGPVPQGQRDAPSPTVETEEPVDPLVATVIGRGTNVNPFGPLAGTENDVANSDSGSQTDSGSKQSTPTSKTTPTKTKSTTTDTDPSVTVDNGSSKKSDPVDLGGTDTGDDEPKADKNVVPEPINTGKDAEDGVSVTMVEVTGDYVVARVEGDRTKLYVNIPGAEGVVYVARLAGKCAWMGRIDSDVRVSVCEGKTEQL